jgi:hypothetical protein
MKKRAARGRPFESFGRGCLKGKADIAVQHLLCNCEMHILYCIFCNPRAADQKLGADRRRIPIDQTNALLWRPALAS